MSISPKTLLNKRLFSDFIKKYNIQRIVILSPHMDDAILSCGGMMYEYSKKIPIKVVTVCTKNPGKVDRSESKFLTEVDLASPKERIAEEENALESLGISLKTLGFIDAVYRRGKNKKLLYPTNLFNYQSVPVKDQATLKLLIARLKKITRKNDLLLYPLGIGGHVDHVLCRVAARRLTKVSKLGYEDFPYTVWHKMSVAKSAYQVRYTLHEKIKLILFYKSQIKMLFGSSKKIKSMLLQRSKSPVEFYIK